SSVTQCIADADRLVTGPVSRWPPLERLATMSRVDSQAASMRAAEIAASDIVPALREFSTMLRTEVLPSAAKTTAIAERPRQLTVYRRLFQRWTTPDEEGDDAQRIIENELESYRQQIETLHVHA